MNVFSEILGRGAWEGLGRGEQNVFQLLLVVVLKIIYRRKKKAYLRKFNDIKKIKEIDKT